jgi:hypothetical protein
LSATFNLSLPPARERFFSDAAPRVRGGGRGHLRRIDGDFMRFPRLRSLRFGVGYDHVIAWAGAARHHGDQYA